MSTKRLRVTNTEMMLVDVPVEQAEHVLTSHDALYRIEEAARWRRQAQYSSEYIEAELTVEDAEGEDPWYAAVLNPEEAGEGYLWSARHFVIQARQQLIMGRYREGHCPDLDRVNTALGRIEEELRLMATAAEVAS